MPETTFGDVLREAEREGLDPSAALAAQSAKPAFCDSCSGPFLDAWLSAYGGHWDTCPNRVRAESSIPTEYRDGIAAIEPEWATDREFWDDYEPSVVFTAPFGVVTVSALAILSAHGWMLLETHMGLPTLPPDADLIPVPEVPGLIANLAAVHAAVTGTGRTVKRRRDATAHLSDLDG